MARFRFPISSQAIVVTCIALGVDYLARKGLRQSWRYVANSDPPMNPAAPETEWREALLWTVVAGISVGIVRLVATRYATALLATSSDDIDEDSLATVTESESVI
ncbi:hypothetical protein BH23VER1_BH23VER1_32440 [soil metagenome]